jgi:hypothetical protein
LLPTYGFDVEIFMTYLCAVLFTCVAISVFSRLTKYPLLFENLAKYTEEDTEELVSVLRAVERSKEILNNVNQAVREAEDIQRLTEIQRRLDKSGFEKVEHPMAGEFKVRRNLLFSGIHLSCECKVDCGTEQWRHDRHKSVRMRTMSVSIGDKNIQYNPHLMVLSLRFSLI